MIVIKNVIFEKQKKKKNKTVVFIAVYLDYKSAHFSESVASGNKGYKTTIRASTSFLLLLDVNAAK